jgi:hypothetical protein
VKIWIKRHSISISVAFIIAAILMFFVAYNINSANPPNLIQKVENGTTIQKIILNPHTSTGVWILFGLLFGIGGMVAISATIAARSEDEKRIDKLLDDKTRKR